MINFKKLFINMFFVLILAGLVWEALGALKYPNRITDERAIQGISEKTGVPVDQIEIVKKTDDSYMYGDTHNVSYDLEISGVQSSANCKVAGWVGDMVCDVEYPK